MPGTGTGSRGGAPSPGGGGSATGVGGGTSASRGVAGSVTPGGLRDSPIGEEVDSFGESFGEEK